MNTAITKLHLSWVPASFPTFSFPQLCLGRPWTRASDGCRFLDQRTAIPPSFGAFEPILQTPRNIQERIQTMSESRRVRQCHDHDKAAGRWTVNTLRLRR